MKRPHKLAQASAYFRLAAKADRAGQYKQGEHYRDRAEHLVAQERREREARKARAAAEAAWRSRSEK